MTLSAVGRYQIIRELGRGGMGTVYLAFDPELSRYVAIKGLLGEHTTPDRRQRLQREARAAASLTHPNIAQVYDVLTANDQDFVVMEYVDGQSLADILEQGPLPPAEVARIGAQIAQALAFAHARGIIHRDIKTENVMVCPDGRVKVLDFGLARMITNPQDQRLTQDGLVVGTSRAMSPEQATGKDVDHRSDIFSLGSLLYEVATGQPAFSGATVLETMHKVAKVEFVPLPKLAPQLPSNLVAAIERCLQKDPQARFQDALELARTLSDSVPTMGTALLPPVLKVTVLATRLGRRAKYGILILALVSTVGVLALRQGWLSAPRPLIVAVLPISGQLPTRTPLVNTAITEALTGSLASLSGVQVVAGREVRAVLQENMGIKELASALGVNELVEAFVSPGEEGRSLMVELRRIDGNTGRIRWSQKLEVGAEDPVLLIQRLGTALTDGFRELRQGRLIRLPPSEALVAYLEVKNRLEQGTPSPNYEDEIALLRRTEELAPNYPDSFIAHASILRFLGTALNDPSKLDEAEKLLARAAKIDPDHPFIPLRRAQLAIAQGNVAEAVAILRPWVARRPGDPAAWAALGSALAKLGRAEESEKTFARALVLQPAITILASLSSARADRGDFTGARQAAEEILRRVPDHPLGLFYLAYERGLTGNFRECEQINARLYPKTRSLLDLLNWGTCAFYAGDLNKAKNLYEQAIELAPRDPRPLANLGDTYFWLGQEGAAKKYFAKALELCEKQTKPLPPVLLAHIYAHLGQLEEAVLEIQKALAAAPKRNWNVFVAAEVAALAGDKVSMLAYGKRARELGAPEQWFSGPEFARYRDLPEFKKLFSAQP